MVAAREREIYRQDAGKLTVGQREQLLKPYLPAKASSTSTIRMFVKAQLHLLVFTIIHMVFSLYIRLRLAYHVVLDRVFAVLYYHHRAPELIKQDVKNLDRLPHHLSVILELKGEGQGLAGLEGLLDEVAEISAWCACAGIPMLSIYERTGELLRGLFVD